MSIDFLLHESSVGYAIFKVVHQPDTIGNRLKEVQDAALELSKFGKMVQVVSFAPFQGAAQALENANEVSEGIVSEYLRGLIDVNIPKQSGKKGKHVVLGVSDKNLANGIKSAFPHIDCETAETKEVVQDLLRGIKLHASKLLKQLQDGDMERAQLGLGHAYSRAKVKFSVQKNDNHIIQAIATLDQLDKAINTFAMRVREWYSWHFPELVKIVSDNHLYAQLALFIKDKTTLSDDSLHDLAAIVNDDESIAKSIIEAARVSMGQEISETDLANIATFAQRVVSLANYRKSLHGYLISKMSIVAPNLAALIGEIVGARLISHAGSLTNLSKYPASTVQILGAEKALFRALKTKGNTPKYGLIYHSSFISRAGTKNKGRISRFLANKCSIASRIDNFSEHPTKVFGEALRSQVEERLEFYASGAPPTKNADVMKTAMDSVLDGMDIDPVSAKVGKHDKNVSDDDDSSEEESDSDEEIEDATPAPVIAKRPENKDKQTGKLTKKTSELDLSSDERKTAKAANRQLAATAAQSGMKVQASSDDSSEEEESEDDEELDEDSSSDEESDSDVEMEDSSPEPPKLTPAEIKAAEKAAKKAARKAAEAAEAAEAARKAAKKAAKKESKKGGEDQSSKQPQQEVTVHDLTPLTPGKKSKDKYDKTKRKAVNDRAKELAKQRKIDIRNSTQKLREKALAEGKEFISDPKKRKKEATKEYKLNKKMKMMEAKAGTA